MKYMVPYSQVKGAIRLVSMKGQLKIDMTYDELMLLLRKFLLAVPVDEAWYRATYPDVDEAIRTGAYRNAQQHFINNGYFEGRRPFRPEVDEDWYLTAHPDVRASIDRGELPSAQEHFIRSGYDEGRMPGEF
jgi:hypothetical protein